MHNLSSSLAAMHFPALKLEELVFLSAASRPFQVDNLLELKKKRREKKKQNTKNNTPTNTCKWTVRIAYPICFVHF